MYTHRTRLQGRGKKRALLIGINYTGTSNELNGNTNKRRLGNDDGTDAASVFLRLY